MTEGAAGVAVPPGPVGLSAPSPDAQAGRMRERYVTFALAAADLLIEADAQGLITYAAGTFEARLGTDALSWIGRPVLDLVVLPDRDRITAVLRQLREHQRVLPQGVRLATADQRPMSLTGLPLPQGDGELRFCLCLASMATAPPPIKPIPDKLSFAQQAEMRLKEGAGPNSLSLFEVTGPDGLVAPRSDIVSQIGAALTEGGQDGRIAGELANGRYGLVQGTQAADLTDLAARIQSVLSKGGMQATVAAHTMSLADTGLTTVQATRALRYALAAFARGGEDSILEEGFAGGLPGFVASATSRAEAMRRILAERRFRLAFQPIVGLRDRRAHHYEALLRPIPAPGFPLEQTQDFVTFAEAVGLVEELDWAVLEAVAQAASRTRNVRIACNLSGHSMASVNFRERFMRMLESVPGLATRLMVEVTETAEINDEEAAVTMVRMLRNRKVQVCLDDFGAGSAAFRYLRLLNIDFVKLDGLYVRGALNNERDRSFISSIVELSASLGAAVVAERIETEAEAQVIRELGVQFGQGYLFGRPGALPDAARWSD
ncbi:EAL domain-containing protein [Roseomonas elaeocarpi]|uniref:EAL domain-containing protein n=1 Tax=Roseomonas elaeocarpi TaxID=907779 RepID=A0ABV6JU16_9PROT